MGGGDLNTKKSWHPNTMKNQERVWKAEQAAAEEAKRIKELQLERAAERDRADLNELAKRTAGASDNDDRLHWMYNKPDKKAQQEDYLLGKAIDKNYDQSDKPDDVIPAVARRVVGSSMLASTGDTQVDLARKIREDPLLLVKERERAARAALLNNPLHRKRLTELLKREQEQKKAKKEGSNKKSKKDKSLDNMLAAKLNALGGDKSIDLAALLGTDSDSSTDSSSGEQTKKKKKKKKSKKEKKAKKSSKRKKDIESESESNSEIEVKLSNDKKKRLSSSEASKGHMKTIDKEYQTNNERRSRKRHSDTEDSDSAIARKRHKHKKYSSDQEKSRKSHKKHQKDRDRSPKVRRRKIHMVDNTWDIEPKVRQEAPTGGKDGKKMRSIRSPERNHNRKTEYKNQKSGGLSEKEREARLAEMAAAGAQREQSRGRRVAEQRASDQRAAPAPRAAPAHALPASLEDRIHSNRHYIQRDSRHMNEHFARR